MSELRIALLRAVNVGGRKVLMEDLMPERAAVGGREVWLYYPAGAGTSKLINEVIERKLGVRGTARNWNTVSKLAALAR